jgi:hypothetical protein
MPSFDHIAGIGARRGLIKQGEPVSEQNAADAAVVSVQLRPLQRQRQPRFMTCVGRGSSLSSMLSQDGCCGTELAL